MAPSLQPEFTLLVEENKGIIFKVIRLYIHNSEDERDLFQEILYQAWKSYPRFDGRSKFSTWLYRVSLNTVLSFKRRPPLVETRETLESKEVVTNDRQEETEMLYTAIRELNEVDRMIITLHLDGYENEEIADISGLTKNNVAVRLHRAKTQVIERVKKI
jgi:RNA polymerase sigma-70 factor (ECF subfamily)